MSTRSWGTVDRPVPEGYLTTTRKQKIARRLLPSKRRWKMKTADDMIQEKGSEFGCVPEGTIVLDVLEKMNARKLGAILVSCDDKPAARIQMNRFQNTAFQPFRRRRTSIGVGLTP